MGSWTPSVWGSTSQAASSSTAYSEPAEPSSPIAANHSAPSAET